MPPERHSRTSCNKADIGSIIHIFLQWYRKTDPSYSVSDLDIPLEVNKASIFHNRFSNLLCARETQSVKVDVENKYCIRTQTVAKLM